MNIVQMLWVLLPVGIEVAGDGSRNNEHKLHAMKKTWLLERKNKKSTGLRSSLRGFPSSLKEPEFVKM